jgi:hypothetical protein
VTYSGRNVSGDVSDKMLNGDGTSAGPMRGSLRTSAGAPTFGPNGGYAVDDQAPTGAAKQAAITASLRNPDGSTWTARDNAVMAANLRDGIDTYRGTSRGAAEASEEAAPKRGEFGYNHYMANKQKDDDRKVTLRGQDMDYQGKMLGNQATLARMQYDMKRDARTDARTEETHAQTVGTKARENAMKEFRVFDAKDPSKVDEGASQQAFDAVRQIFPGIDSADEGTRNKFMADAKEMHAIFQKARGQDKVGWDAAKFWEAKRPQLSAMPNAAGGKTEEVGPIAGMFTWGASNGDTILKRNGRNINLGRLNEQQLALLERAKTQGWGK